MRATVSTRVPQTASENATLACAQLLRSVGRTVTYDAGAHLFLQGDAPSGVHEILSGTVILSRVTPDGRRHIHDFATAGDCLGLNICADYDLGADALTDVTTRFIPKSIFMQAMEDNPNFRHDVMRIMSQMLSDAQRHSVLLGVKSALERTAAFILLLDERFGALASGYTRIEMSRCDIADHLGLTLETVSRMLSRLKQLAVIEMPRPDSFRIMDREALKALAAEPLD